MGKGSQVPSLFCLPFFQWETILTTTLNDLKTQVLQRCNMEYSNFIADSEMLYMLNSSLAHLYEELVLSFEDYFIDETYFTLSTGEFNQPLPADFFKLIAVDVLLADGYCSLERWIWNERDRYERNNLGGHVGFLKYKITGNNLEIRPRAMASGLTYRVVYVPRFPEKTSLSDTVEDSLVLQNWHEFAIVDTCIKVYQKQQEDVSAFAMQKAELFTRIKKHMQQRDQGRPVYMAERMDPFLDKVPTRRW